MNVLYISHESGPSMMGGASWSLFYMIKACERYGIKSVVVMPKKGYAYSFFSKQGIECYAVPYKINVINSRHNFKYHTKYFPKLLRNICYNKMASTKIISMFRDKNIDVVHSNTSVLDIGPSIAKGLGAKHVWHLREFQDKDFNKEPLRGWNRLLGQVHNSDGVIAISRAIYNHFECEKCKKATCKFNPVFDVEEEKIELQPTNKQIMFCGYLSRGKQPDMALRIFAVFNQTHPDYRMVILGKFASEEYEREIRCLISTLGIERAVDIVGYTEDTSKYYKDSRAFIMSSRNEAMGRVTVEAMFNGCIVLGYNSGGTSEIIEDGVTGFLFHDESEAVEKLTAICDNYEDMQNIRKQAYSYSVANFSVSQYGKFLLDFYDKL